MKRGAPLKRTAWKRKPPSPHVRPERSPLPAYKATAAWRDAKPVDDVVRAVEKDEPIQHLAYMAAVRKLACIRCGIQGFTQFCHSDAPGGKGGKAKGLKSDCRLGWPGCGPHGDTMGCHYLVGSTGQLGKAQRRITEAEYGRQTRALIRSMGLWPKTLPPWPGDEAESAHTKEKP